MPLLRLLHPRRYARCRQMFRRALLTHARLAIGRRRSMAVEFLDGGRALVERPRSFRRVFDELLSGVDDPGPVTWRGGVLSFMHGGRRVALRPDTTDAYIFGEVCLDDCYGIGGGTEKFDTIVDLGANIGLFAAQAAACAARVVAVEPVAANREVAALNLEEPLADGRATLVAAAIGARTGGTTRIYLSENSGGHSIDAGHAGYWGHSGFEDVPTLSLADLFRRHGVDRCDLLKCDVEGAEYEILGAAPLDVLARIDRIVLEAHIDRQSLAPARLTDLVARLRAAGMRVEHQPIDLREAPRQSLMVRARRAPTAARRLLAAA